MRNIYEWRWTRPGGEPHTTRSTRTAHAYRRFAEKFGGKVTRHVIGFRLDASLNEMAAAELQAQE